MRQTAWIQILSPPSTGGRINADDVLRRIAGKLLESVKPTGGIIGRLGADTFMLYLQHRDDYAPLLEELSVPSSMTAGGSISTS